MTNNAFQESADKQAQQLRDSAGESINSIHKALVIDIPKAQIAESAFVQFFLPYFSGKQNDPVLQGRNVVNEWVGLAGSAMSEVDVCDNSGQTVFSVPALFDTNMLEIASRSPGKSFADVFYEYELRKGGIPIVAKNFLNSALSDKTQSILGNAAPADSVAQRWSNIMQRYNIAPAADGIKNQSAAQIPDDDVTYE